MLFRAFGAFQIQLDALGNIPKDLRYFWEEVEEEKAGLGGAKGCYLFAIRTSGGSSIRPWYVGKTGGSFAKECFLPHKRVHYATAMSHYERATPLLFLIPRMTTGGVFFKGSAAVAIGILEEYLIGLALQANKDLLNKKDTKFWRDVKLPGILNSDGRTLDKSAKELRQALRIKAHPRSVAPNG